MGWGCYKHEWDAGSENWSAYAERLCDERLEKTIRADWGRDGQICPKCYEELEAECDELRRQRDLLVDRLKAAQQYVIKWTFSQGSHDQCRGPGGHLYDLYVAPIEAAIQECKR